MFYKMKNCKVTRATKQNFTGEISILINYKRRVMTQNGKVAKIRGELEMKIGIAIDSNMFYKMKNDKLARPQNKIRKAKYRF